MMRWTSYWTKAFDEGRHMDGRLDGEYVARVFELERLVGLPVMPHRCGRQRRLFLAMACLRGKWMVVGVYGTSGAAKWACERALEESIS
ncbi:MAG: hypothetical protein IT437_13525 [Phycisphaerales bacterium]|nr:hypothetical protein [Phycisphaerales bacterium]